MTQIQLKVLTAFRSLGVAQEVAGSAAAAIDTAKSKVDGNIVEIKDKVKTIEAKLEALATKVAVHTWIFGATFPIVAQMFLKQFIQADITKLAE